MFSLSLCVYVCPLAHVFVSFPYSSFNCVDWHLLPPATEAMLAEVSAAAKGRFVGDPSHEYEHTEIRRQGEGDEAVEEEIMVGTSVTNYIA